VTAWRALALGLGLGLAGPVAAPALAGECRMALAMALDVSGSVDRQEYDLQMTGLAGALTAPSVVDAFLARPEAPVDLYLFVWSGLGTQQAVTDWRTIRSSDDLAAVAQALTGPGYRPHEPETAVGMALVHGAAKLAERQGCERRVIDISSDGRSNIGPSPRMVRDGTALAGVTINALAIGIAPGVASGYRSDTIEALSGYYRNEVIQGEDAFVQVAKGYRDYRVAMEKKLMRELEVPAVGWNLR
jgi:hypothetical protein